MSAPSVLVLRAAGINCDEETVHAWRLAGANASLIHVNDLAESPDQLKKYSLLTIPGGFSYGDDIGAGVILAQRLGERLADAIREFVELGGGVLGICNGFQVLVKMGLLPGGAFRREDVTVTYNDSARFEARWVRLETCTQKCPYLGASDSAGGRPVFELPVEHAEGRVVTTDEAVAQRLFDAGHVALRYVDVEGRSDRYPANPNGSTRGIAGLCDPTGRVFGLMPHPDRFFDAVQHPFWTSRPRTNIPDGLRIFQNAVRFWTAR